jgi:hypothetical protein
MVDTGLGNEQGFLRLSAWAAPELRVEGQLRQNMSVLLLHEIPGHARLSVSAGAGQRGYAGQALLHIGQCTLGVTGGILPSPGLQGSVVYYNNCTVVQVECSCECVHVNDYRESILLSWISFTICIVRDVLFWL